MATGLHGIEIRSSALATHRVMRVERHPILKRRRRWRLVWRTEPAAFMVGDILVMHPDLISQLPKATA